MQRSPPDNILSGRPRNRRHRHRMDHSARERQKQRRPQRHQPEKDQPRNQRGPQPHIPRAVCRERRIILIPQLLRRRLLRREHRTPHPVPPSEHPLQRHVHLRIRRHLRQIRQTRIPRRHPLPVRHILRIRKHHRALNRIRHEIRPLQRKRIPEIPEIERLRISDHLRDPRRLHVVVTRLQQKRHRHADQKQQHTKRLSPSGTLHQKLLLRCEDWIPSSSRYFATVLRATSSPRSFSSAVSLLSESGDAGFSRSTRSRMISLTPRDEISSPCFDWNPPREEVLEFKHPPRRLDILVCNRPADRRFMKPELVRHLLHRHRLQVFDPLCKEIVLRSHNDIRNSLDRFLPLFERLHQSVSARDLRPDVRADILRRIRILQKFQIIL